MLTVKDINEEPLILDDFVLIARNTFHTENSIAYRIEFDGKSIVYSGDTGYTESLIDIAKDADMLIIECSFPDELKFKTHLTPSEVGMIARASKAKNVILTHLYADCDEIDIVSQVRKHVDVDVILAEDLMEIDI